MFLIAPQYIRPDHNGNVLRGHLISELVLTELGQELDKIAEVSVIRVRHERKGGPQGLQSLITVFHPGEKIKLN